MKSNWIKKNGKNEKFSFTTSLRLEKSWTIANHIWRLRTADIQFKKNNPFLTILNIFGTLICFLLAFIWKRIEINVQNDNLKKMRTFHSVKITFQKWFDSENLHFCMEFFLLCVNSFKMSFLQYFFGVSFPGLLSFIKLFVWINESENVDSVSIFFSFTSQSNGFNWSAQERNHLSEPKNN